MDDPLSPFHPVQNTYYAVELIAVKYENEGNCGGGDADMARNNSRSRPRSILLLFVRSFNVFCLGVSRAANTLSIGDERQRQPLRRRRRRLRSFVRSLELGS